MNTAKNLIKHPPVLDRALNISVQNDTTGNIIPVVNGDMPVVNLLPRLLESPSHTLTVSDGDREIGILTETRLLEGLAQEISQNEDCAMITLRCNPGDYSASRIAMAIEDTGNHLLDLFSRLSDSGYTEVSLRVRCDDPTGAVHSLERYGFEVTRVYARQYADACQAAERLMALQAYLNV